MSGMKSIKKGGLNRRVSLGLAGAKGGLGLLQAKVSGIFLPQEQKKAHAEEALEREALKFVAHLGELKGAYVKIGQMLALYGEHILPKQVTDALHTLESSTLPLDWEVIEPAIEDELGLDATKLLAIERKAMAAASLSQVHRGSIGNEAICFKIQYPGITDAIEDDFKNVIQMLSFAKWIKSGRQMEQLTKDLKEYLLKEVRYSYELMIAEEVSSLIDDNRYKVPKYFPEYSSDKILTMEYVNGFDVMDQEVQQLSQRRRNRLAEAMLELFFKEAFEWNLMQTDPNFGNYRVLIDQSGNEQDRLVLLDFGAVHELTPAFSRYLKKTILAAQDQNEASVIEGLIKLNCLSENSSKLVQESFSRFCIYILEPFRKSFEDVPKYALANEVYDWKHSRLLKRAGKLGSQQALLKGFQIPPPEFMLMVRKLTGVFTFVAALGARTRSYPVLAKYQAD